MVSLLDLQFFLELEHPSLVKVRGVCLTPPQLLVDFVDKTLHDYLFETSCPPLSWVDRLRVMVEVTTGLLYLHSVSSGDLKHRYPFVLFCQ